MSTATLSFLAAVLLSGQTATDGYRLQMTLKVPGDGGWDYLTVDGAARRVYLSHGSQVDVLDADSGAVTGTIHDTAGVHGIAVAPDLGRGFTSNGKAGTVTVFDLTTLKTLGVVPVGKNPDCIIYDPGTKRVFAFNGGSRTVSVLDAAAVAVVATVELGGKPEFAAADGDGHVFVNLEDTSELLKLDARQPGVLARWPVAPGQEPSSLAIDRRHHRLFVGCRNKRLAVVNAETGAVVTTLPLGAGVDATAYDQGSGLIVSSTGEGTVTVVKQNGPDGYAVVETVTTRRGSRTLALDPKTHRLYVPAAEFTPAPPPSKDVPRPRPQMVPGSFVLLVYGK